MTRPWWALVVCLCAFVAPAQAASLQRFYPPSSPADDIRPMGLGADGRVWLALRAAIGAVDRDGTLTTYATGGLTPDAIAAGPDGAEWFVAKGTVARVTGGATTVVAQGLTGANAITAGPDGAMWVALGERGQVARVASDGSVRRINVGTGVYVAWLVAGPDGNLWFSGWKANRIFAARVTGDGAVQTFGLPSGSLIGGVPSIAAGHDGNLWLATGDTLTRVTPTGQTLPIKLGGEAANALAVAPDGAIWFSSWSDLIRRAPSGQLSAFPDPFATATDCDPLLTVGPATTLAIATDGTVWTPYPEGALDRFTSGPAAPPPVRPVLPARGSFKAPDSLVRGVDGDAWIATPRGVIRVDATGRRTVFHPWHGRRHVSLAPAADGGVWLSAGPGLSRLSPAGRVRSYSRRLPRHADINELAPGRRGSVWYVDVGRRAVARLTTAGRVHEVHLGRRAAPYAIAARSDGGVWVTDSHHAIELVSASGHLRRFARPGTTVVPAITAAADGTAWFADFDGRRVGHVTASGRIHSYRTHGHPTAIALGPDGAVWFTTTAHLDALALGRPGFESTPRAGLGRIDAAGREREFPVHPTCSTTDLGLITGPDGNLWFAEDHGPIAVAEMDPQRLLATGAL
jgi:virginiamycin B lyase